MAVFITIRLIFEPCSARVFLFTAYLVSLREARFRERVHLLFLTRDIFKSELCSPLRVLQRDQIIWLRRCTMSKLLSYLGDSCRV